MASGSKRKKVKAFILKSFSSNGGKAMSNDVQLDKSPTAQATGSSDITRDPLSPSTSAPKVIVSESSPQAPGIDASLRGGIFSNASCFSVHHPVMMDNATVHIHGTSDRRKAAAMERLSKRIIHGADHDSSARDPPPRCHPGTRIQINEDIITWFYDEGKNELLIWIYGPAGVGKSAIMQTLAEKLAKSKHLGASVFISRPSGRNASRQLFLTIAYQLAVHIEDYCTFITAKLGRDPELVNKGIEEQFKIFIVEPFVEKKIGAGGARWGILLDGLDELDENQSQRKIIRLIANLVLKHPDVPLLWAIASRPEPHICDTFDREEVVTAYWKKHVPASTKESREDVELFLRDSLERIQKDFSRMLPKKWPKEDQFSNLTVAASGLFAFADTAIRFIEDPRYANPTMRLDQVLSALNGLPATSPTQPFASLDALYTSILSSISPDVWPTTKRVLGAFLYTQGDGHRRVLRMLGSISIILGLDLTEVYASLHGCYSLLNVSDPENVHRRPSTFYHTSFSDYLLDSNRSKDFHISMGEVEDDMLQSFLHIWHEFKTKFPPAPGFTYENRWLKTLLAISSFENWDNDIHQIGLMQCIHEALFIFLVEKHDPKGERPFSSEEDQHQCFELLSQLEDATLCDGFWEIGKLSEFLLWLFDMWEINHEELVSRKVIQEVKVTQAQFSVLETPKARIHLIQGKLTLKELTYDEANSAQLFTDVSHLGLHFPHLPVLVCGHQKRGCLIFRHQADISVLENHGLNSISLDGDQVWKYFAISHSQSNFYHDTEHFLRISLEAIQAKYSYLAPNTWPTNEQLLKLVGAAPSQPVFVTTAIRFIEDPHISDPVTCLNDILALIDEADSSNNQPFIGVDALYSHILYLVPSDMWPTTQQVLGALYYGTTHEGSSLRSPRGIAAILGIELSVVYTALNGCYPMVQISPMHSPLGSMAFHHPSFCEYLMDPTRSQECYISMEDIENHLFELLINIWRDFKEQSYGVIENYYSLWDNYCSKYHPDPDPSDDSLIKNFNLRLLQDTHDALFLSINQDGTTQLDSNQDQFFHIFSQLNFTTIWLGFGWLNWRKFVIWLFDIWSTNQAELTNRGLLHEIKFQELQPSLLNSYNGCFHSLYCKIGEEMHSFRGNMITFLEKEEYILGLKQFQQHKPQLPVLIGGDVGDQFAIFEYEYTEGDLKEQLHHPQRRSMKAGDLGYYILPYFDK